MYMAATPGKSAWGGFWKMNHATSATTAIVDRLNAICTALTCPWLCQRLCTRADTQAIIRSPGRLISAVASKINGRLTDIELFIPGSFTLSIAATMPMAVNAESRNQLMSVQCSKLIATAPIPATMVSVAMIFEDVRRVSFMVLGAVHLGWE